MPPASCYLLSAICFLLPASCFLLPALRIKLSASCFMHSASSSPLMHRALRSLLPASDFLPPALSASTLYSLRPLLSAICFLLPASCALCLYPLLFTLYSLLPALSALCPQPSAFCSMSFNRHPPKNGLPGSCIGGGQSRSSSTHRKKRVRSATSRRTPTLSVCYQLAFFTPGMRPFEAISRNWIRLMPN